MIEIKLDTSGLEAKLKRARQSITDSIETGVKVGTEALAKDIDEFMYVPLAFTTVVSQNGEDTVAKTNVSLNIPKKMVRNRKPSRKRGSYFTREKKTSSRSWKDYVKELSGGSKAVADSVETSVTEDLR